MQHPPTPDPTPAALIAARPALTMHARSGLLLDGVPLGPIAAQIGTPAWVAGADTLRARARALTEALAQALPAPAAAIHYAVKANDHLAILAVIAAEGLGADVVSDGELARALAAGIPPARIVFSGVGKTQAELTQALAANIAQINVESAEELDMLSALARTLGRRAPLVLRINPDIDAATHDKITTGRAGDKFGIDAREAIALYRQAAADPALNPLGLALHIGSQIGTLAPYRAAWQKLAALVQTLRAENLPVERLDCGGGLAITYRDEPAASPAAIAGLLATTLGPLGLPLIIEPGRWLIGPAGLLLARVIRVRRTAGRPIVILDAAMNDLLRPALYDAWHGIVPLAPNRLHAPLTAADVAGPVCESSDIFARARALPALEPDDIVAILDAGAYGAVMSSPYNARPAAPQVLIDRGSWHLIRPRPTQQDLWRDECIPPHLTNP
jgi:diaminopimelate decarboxylase